MHADIKENLASFAEERVDDIGKTQNYDKMMMSVLNTEVMLGEAEREYDADNDDHEGYIDALDDIWHQVCEAAVHKAKMFADDSNAFADKLNLSPKEIRTDLHDNYFHAALAAVFAAREDASVKKLPLLSAAAFNKHTYAGYKDEIACLRMLLWAGFDPNAADSDGMTALHMMASLRTDPGSHPRAVRLLLQAGVAPNLKNRNGDTALCYLAGNTSWNDVHTESAWLLLDNGADPLAEANDGACAYSLWKQNLEISDDVAEIVASIESVMEELPEPKSDGNEAYYESVGDQILTLLKAADADGLYNFFGYLMAIVVAKKIGEDDQFAKKITPLMLDGLDGEDLLEKLGDSLEDGDSVSIGRIAHAYLAKAAKAQFEKLQASMQE